MVERDKKGRPTYATDDSNQLEVLAELLRTWHYHPKWHLGQLVQKALNIPSGTRTSVEFGSDADLLYGLRALVPDEWEIELDGQA